MMDITPQLLKDIKISDGFRGYNKDEVNELIERVGAAIMQLQGRLRDAVDRAETAESQASGLAGRSDAEDTLRRTLVLAQRTADAAIAEARTDAERIMAEANDHSSRVIAEADAYAKQTTADADDRAVRAIHHADEHVATVTGDADAKAQRLVSEAEAQATVLRSEAEAEVRRMVEDSRAPIMEEIRDLERIRSFLSDDISLLEQHLNTGRDRLRLQIADLHRIVEEPSALRLDPVPETSGISAPTPAAASALAEAAIPARHDQQIAHDAEAEYAGEAADGYNGEPSGEVDAADAPTWAPEPDALRAEREPSYSPVWPEHDNSEADTEGDGALDATAVRDDFVSDDDDDGRNISHGEPTQAISALDFGENTGDQFLDQLRRVVDDDGSLDSDAMSEFFSGDVDEGPRSRFGRRR